MSQVYKLTDSQIEKLAKVVKVSFTDNDDGLYEFGYDGSAFSLEVKPSVIRKKQYIATIITDSKTLPIESESVKKLVECILKRYYDHAPKSLDKDLSDAIEAL